MLSPYEVKDAIVSRASIGVVLDPGVGSPNRFLYIGAGDGPNTPPTGSGKHRLLKEQLVNK